MSTNARHAVVVGLGKTGLSAVRYLAAHGAQVAVTDSRSDPPGRAALAASGVPAVVRTGGFDTALLEGADLVVLSPGVAPVGEFFEAVRARGLPIVGDIELFARAVRAPVAAITGTNGKSTVTTLLGQMALRAGRAVRVGGNLGAPALELLDARADLYVLELSSFQLESTSSLRLIAAAVLNVTPDHLDRYGTLGAYAAAKARIFAQCECAVVNLDDELVRAMPRAARRCLSFSLRPDAGADYSLATRDSAGRHSTAHEPGPWLLAHGEPLLPLAQLRIAGLHNAANALAALALGEALALPRAACLAALREFTGLPHRMQGVADRRGVRYIDDSKGTNVGATLAAVLGLAAPVRGPGPADTEAALIVIAGGEGKGQDFTPLRAAFAGRVRHTLLIGRDAPRVAAALADACPCESCASLPAAVARAAQLARPGDTVLLSPACASLDMFRDYAHRGEVFAQAARELPA